MKKVIPITVALALGVIVASAQTATNAPPDRMSYQGYLVDANGAPLAPSTPVNYPVTFRVWTAATGGTRVWSESQVVTVDKGNFSVVLGEGSVVPGEARPPLSTVIANSDTASDRFIGITVTINSVATDILPRLRLLPTPYAFLATSARNLTAPNGSTVLVYTNNRVEVVGDIRTTGTVSGSAGMGVLANNVLEFGIGVAGKEVNAGKIGYQAFSGAGGALDIVGAGTSGTDRKVRFFAEGGTTFSGRVGIGNFSPQRLLHVGATAAQGSEGMIRLESRSATGGAAFGWDIGVPQTGEDTSGVGYSFVIDSPGRGGNDFIVRWDNANVGIGTATPAAKLDVSGSIAMRNSDILQARNSANVLENVFWPRWSDNVTYLNYGSGGFNIRNNTSTTRMFLQDNGNVGIGTSTPETPLQVGGYGTAANQYLTVASAGGNQYRSGIRLRHFNGGYGWSVESDERDNTFRLLSHFADSTGVTRMTVDHGGTLNMRGGALQVDNGGANYIKMYRSSTGLVIEGNNTSFGSPRFIQWDGDNNWDVLSDRRLKKDITDAEPVLERLMNLPVRRYRWKEETNDTPKNFGVIAQEVEALFPDVVGRMTKPGDGEESLTVKYGAFGLLAVKALQEFKAQKEIEQAGLRKEIDDLKSEVTTLKGRVAQAERVDALQDELMALKAVVHQLQRNSVRQQAAHVESSR